MNYLEGPLPDLFITDTIDYDDDRINATWNLYRREQQYHAVVAAWLLTNSLDTEARQYAAESVRMGHVVALLTEERHARGFAERVIADLRKELGVTE